MAAQKSSSGKTPGTGIFSQAWQSAKKWVDDFHAYGGEFEAVLDAAKSTPALVQPTQTYCVADKLLEAIARLAFLLQLDESANFLAEQRADLIEQFIGVHCGLRAALHRIYPKPAEIDKRPHEAIKKGLIVPQPDFPSDWPRTPGVEFFTKGGGSALDVCVAFATDVHRRFLHWCPFKYNKNTDEVPAWVERAGPEHPKFIRWYENTLAAIRQTIFTNTDTLHIHGRLEALRSQLIDEYGRASEKTMPLSLKLTERVLPELNRLATESEQAETGKEKKESFNTADLRKMTGLGNTAFNKYAKSAGVESPGRGKKNFRYPRGDARKILEEIISTSTHKIDREMAKSSLINHF